MDRDMVFVSSLGVSLRFGVARFDSAAMAAAVVAVVAVLQPSGIKSRLQLVLLKIADLKREAMELMRC